jgi:hypothetical protein
MVVAEFLFIAFVVGMVTKAWMGFLGTFIVLYALYRFTRLSAVLGFALSLYWGFLGYHLGAATGEFGAAPLLAVVAFLVAIWLHIEGLHRPSTRTQPPPGSAFVEPPDCAARCAPRAPAGAASAAASSEVIDVEYRVVSP